MANNKMSYCEKIMQFALIVLLICLCSMWVYPFIHVASIAFSTQAEAFRPGLHLYPHDVDTTSFIKVFKNPSIWTAYYNTVFRTVIGTTLSVMITGMGAYALSKKYLPFRRTIFLAILFTMYFHGGMISGFLVMRALGLLDSRWSMILPSLVWGFNLIIMKNFFQTIPASLEESAKIDGASDLLIFYKIVVPLSKAVIATIAMWMAVYHWNAYFDNLLYINDTKLYVLQRFIRNLLIDEDIQSMITETTYSNPESLKASTILISTIPILMVYPFAQKYFIKGVMIGSVKG